MADFAGPSFSLGLDLDFDQSAPPNNEQEESRCCSKQSIEEAAAGATTTGEEDVVNSTQSIEEEDYDQDFQPQTLFSSSELILKTSPPIPIPNFKRLKRGPIIIQPDSSSVKVSADDEEEEIENISSPDHNNIKGDHTALQNGFACSSSKSPSYGLIPLSEPFTSKLKAKQRIQTSNASAFRSMEASSSNPMFSKLTTSPLRRFQLLDSDSDDASSSEDLFDDALKVNVCTNERQCNSNRNLTLNLQKRDELTGSKLQTEVLWKDFGPQKSANIPTPALDEFCEEYFRSVKDKKVDQTKEGDIYIVSPKACDHKSGISGNAELFNNLHNPLPPTYMYFYHDDPRIQRLVRQRLPNFSPLGVKNAEIPQSQVADIDYMCQFSQKEPTSRNQGLDGISSMGIQNLKQSTSNHFSQGSWVSPKNCINGLKNAGKSQGRVDGCSSRGPKNAGKRRVRADERSFGSWFTGEGGRKVYVSKNGQELTGQMAYRHYKKESGTGFKKSRKKAASKKKSKRC